MKKYNKINPENHFLNKKQQQLQNKFPKMTLKLSRILGEPFN